MVVVQNKIIKFAVFGFKVGAYAFYYFYLYCIMSKVIVVGEGAGAQEMLTVMCIIISGR